MTHKYDRPCQGGPCTDKGMATPGFCRCAIDAAKIERLTTENHENQELNKLFDLRWKADMRAINRWQKQTGKTLIWPDHADLCVWLLEQLDDAQQSTQDPANAKSE